MYDAKICVIFLINLFLFLRLVEMFQLPTYNTKSKVSPVPGRFQGQFGWGRRDELQLPEFKAVGKQWQNITEGEQCVYSARNIPWSLLQPPSPLPTELSKVLRSNSRTLPQRLLLSHEGGGSNTRTMKHLSQQRKGDDKRNGHLKLFRPLRCVCVQLGRWNPVRKVVIYITQATLPFPT